MIERFFSLSSLIEVFLNQTGIAFLEEERINDSINLSRKRELINGINIFEQIEKIF